MDQKGLGRRVQDRLEKSGTSFIIDVSDWLPKVLRALNNWSG